MFKGKVFFKLAVLFIITATTLLLSCQGSDKVDTKVDVSVPIIDSVASSDGVNIVFDVSGPESDITLVFVHCWSCDRSYWRNQAPEFAKDYKIVCIDLAGHGESGLNREDWTMPAYGLDVAAVVTKLGIEKCILIGHSMGGPVVVEAARNLPGKVIGLIGVDNFDNYGNPIPPEGIQGYLTALKADFAGTTSGHIASIIGPKADSSLTQWIIDDMSGGDATVGVESMLQIFEYAYNEPVLLALKEINLPLYLINAPSNTGNLELVEQSSASVEVKVQDSVKHFGHMTDPQTFNDYLKEAIVKISIQPKT